jgi:WXG100 family type VII secretion target
MAGQVTVNRAAMVTAAQQVDGALGDIRSQQARLVSTNDTLRGGWQGEASTAFTNAFEKFNSDFGIVINALNGIHERLVGSHANYNTVEAANTTSAGKITSLLNR